MAEDPEKRFQRAMDSLFAGKSFSPPTAAAGSAKRGGNVGRVGHVEQAKGTPHKIVLSALSPAALRVSAERQRQCRPWDRGDLLRRLATFKSTMWFGKPQAAGPMACARRGWINVEVDLLECDGCGVRLGISLPPSVNDVSSFVEDFVEQLESKHKSLCPWKGNACSEALALFPPTPVGALVEGFKDRCESLLRLSALPVISGSASNAVKVWGGSRMEGMFAYPTPLVPEVPQSKEPSGREAGELAETEHHYNGFHYAQRMIAVCGWDTRRVPYSVNSEESVSLSSGMSLAVSPIGSKDAGKSKDSGLHVMLNTGGRKGQEESQVGCSGETQSDPASTVLDCSMCGASVGLWNFSTIPQPAEVLSAVQSDVPEPHPHAKEVTEVSQDAGDGKAKAQVRPSMPGVLRLNLTIAGGPPPTQLSSPANPSPRVFPIPAFHSGWFGQAEGVQVEKLVTPNEPSSPGRQDGVTVGGTLDTNGKPESDIGEGTVVDHDVDEKSAGSRKRSPRTIGSGVDRLSKDDDGLDHTLVKTEMETDGFSLPQKRRKTSQTDAQAAGPSSDYAGNEMQNFPASSSVLAMDTDLLPKGEDSVETIENWPQEQGTPVDSKPQDLGDHIVGSETAMPVLPSGIGSQEVGSGLMNGDEVKYESFAFESIAMGIMGDAYDKSGLGRGVVSEGSDVGGGLSMLHGDSSSVVDAKLVADETQNQDLLGESAQAAVLMNQSTTKDEDVAPLLDVCGDSDTVAHAPCPDEQGLLTSSMIQIETVEKSESRIHSQSDGRMGDNETAQTTKMDTGESSREAVDEGIIGTPIATGVESERIEEAHKPAGGLVGVPAWDVKIGEFDPIRQHRHFCPWVTGSITAEAKGGISAVCGWQVTLNALHTQREFTVIPTHSSKS